MRQNNMFLKTVQNTIIIYSQDKLEKLKIALVKLEADKRALQEELSRNENRSTKLELQRMSAEGDIQRLQLMLQEKDATIQVIKTL